MDANDVAGGIASPSGEGIAGTCRKHSFLFTTNDIFLSNYVVLPTLSQIYILPCVLATAVLAVASLQASNARAIPILAYSVLVSAILITRRGRIAHHPRMHGQIKIVAQV